MTKSLNEIYDVLQNNAKITLILLEQFQNNILPSVPFHALMDQENIHKIHSNEFVTVLASFPKKKSQNSYNGFISFTEINVNVHTKTSEKQRNMTIQEKLHNAVPLMTICFSHVLVSV